jgi:hypothetical protein
MSVPAIAAQSWSEAVPGGTLQYEVTVRNPGPARQESLFVYVFIGCGNVDPDTGTFLLDVGTQCAAFALDAGAETTLAFDLPVPPTIDPAGYFGHTFLMQVGEDGVGQHLGRATFPVRHAAKRLLSPFRVA